MFFRKKKKKKNKKNDDETLENEEMEADDDGDEEDDDDYVDNLDADEDGDEEDTESDNKGGDETVENADDDTKEDGKSGGEEADEAKEPKPELTPEEKKKKKQKMLMYIAVPAGLILVVVILMMMRGEAQPRLGLSTTDLDFGNSNAGMTFTIKNAATADSFFKKSVKPLKFKIKTEGIDNWIKVNPDSGVCDGTTKSIDVSINRELITPGNHVGELRISSNGGDEIVRALAQKDREKITITFPTTRYSTAINKKVTIGWTASAGASNSVDIELYLNGSKVETIVNNYKFRKKNTGTGQFAWKVGGNAVREGSNYSIKIVDSNEPQTFDEVGPLKITQPLTGISVLNETTNHQTPSTVQFIFSLRNQNNHAILFNPSEVDWKDIKIWENDEEIDYLESHALLYTQDDFQLQTMLVLDFSASMYDTKADINKMILSAKDLIDSLNETHQVGVIEFHRPDTPPALLQTFTTYKEAAKEAIDKFSAGKVYRDFSICWDAVKKGLNQFPKKSDPNVFKTLLFLSDGFDNSSYSSPEEIIELAKAKDVHIFVVGVGEVHEEERLKSVAFMTGGTYVHAENIDVLRQRFKQSIKDLKGQYKIKHITPKKPDDGTFTVRSEITYKDVIGDPVLYDEIEPKTIFTKTINGVLRFSAPSVIKYNRAEVFLWCEHAPRYINEFRFWIGAGKNCKVELTSFKDGGLCQDWILERGQDGWHKLTSPDKADPKQNLEFGDFGTICKIIITDIKDKGIVIPFKLDNSIYDMGQAFYGKNTKRKTKTWSTNIHVGQSNAY